MELGIQCCKLDIWIYFVLLLQTACSSTLSWSNDTGSASKNSENPHRKQHTKALLTSSGSEHYKVTRQNQNPKISTAKHIKSLSQSTSGISYTQQFTDKAENATYYNAESAHKKHTTQHRRITPRHEIFHKPTKRYDRWNPHSEEDDDERFDDEKEDRHDKDDKDDSYNTDDNDSDAADEDDDENKEDEDFDDDEEKDDRHNHAQSRENIDRHRDVSDRYHDHITPESIVHDDMYERPEIDPFTHADSVDRVTPRPATFEDSPDIEEKAEERMQQIRSHLDNPLQLNPLGLSTQNEVEDADHENKEAKDFYRYQKIHSPGLSQENIDHSDSTHSYTRAFITPDRIPKGFSIEDRVHQNLNRGHDYSEDLADPAAMLRGTYRMGTMHFRSPHHWTPAVGVRETALRSLIAALKDETAKSMQLEQGHYIDDDGIHITSGANLNSVHEFDANMHNVKELLDKDSLINFLGKDTIRDIISSPPIHHSSAPQPSVMPLLESSPFLPASDLKNIDPMTLDPLKLVPPSFVADPDTPVAEVRPSDFVNANAVSRQKIAVPAEPTPKSQSTNMSQIIIHPSRSGMVLVKGGAFVPVSSKTVLPGESLENILSEISPLSKGSPSHDIIKGFVKGDPNMPQGDTDAHKISSPDMSADVTLLQKLKMASDFIKGYKPGNNPVNESAKATEISSNVFNSTLNVSQNSSDYPRNHSSIAGTPNITSVFCTVPFNETELGNTVSTQVSTNSSSATQAINRSIPPTKGDVHQNKKKKPLISLKLLKAIKLFLQSEKAVRKLHGTKSLKNMVKNSSRIANIMNGTSSDAMNVLPNRKTSFVKNYLKILEKMTSNSIPTSNSSRQLGPPMYHNASFDTEGIRNLSHANEKDLNVQDVDSQTQTSFGTKNTHNNPQVPADVQKPITGFQPEQNVAPDIPQQSSAPITIPTQTSGSNGIGLLKAITGDQNARPHNVTDGQSFADSVTEELTGRTESANRIKLNIAATNNEAQKGKAQDTSTAATEGAPVVSTSSGTIVQGRGTSSTGNGSLAGESGYRISSGGDKAPGEGTTNLPDATPTSGDATPTSGESPETSQAHPPTTTSSFEQQETANDAKTNFNQLPGAQQSDVSNKGPVNQEIITQQGVFQGMESNVNKAPMNTSNLNNLENLSLSNQTGNGPTSLPFNKATTDIYYANSSESPKNSFENSRTSETTLPEQGNEQSPSGNVKDNAGTNTTSITEAIAHAINSNVGTDNSSASDQLNKESLDPADMRPGSNNVQNTSSSADIVGNSVNDEQITAFQSMKNLTVSALPSDIHEPVVLQNPAELLANNSNSNHDPQILRGKNGRVSTGGGVTVGKSTSDGDSGGRSASGSGSSSAGETNGSGSGSTSGGGSESKSASGDGDSSKTRDVSGSSNGSGSRSVSVGGDASGGESTSDGNNTSSDVRVAGGATSSGGKSVSGSDSGSGEPSASGASGTYGSSGAAEGGSNSDGAAASSGGSVSTGGRVSGDGSSSSGGGGAAASAGGHASGGTSVPASAGASVGAGVSGGGGTSGGGSSTSGGGSISGAGSSSSGGAAVSAGGGTSNGTGVSGSGSTSGGGSSASGGASVSAGGGTSSEASVSGSGSTSGGGSSASGGASVSAGGGSSGGASVSGSGSTSGGGSSASGGASVSTGGGTSGGASVPAGGGTSGGASISGSGSTSGGGSSASGGASVSKGGSSSSGGSSTSGGAGISAGGGGAGGANISGSSSGVSSGASISSGNTASGGSSVSGSGGASGGESGPSTSSAQVSSGGNVSGGTNSSLKGTSTGQVTNSAGGNIGMNSGSSSSATNLTSSSTNSGGTNSTSSQSSGKTSSSSDGSGGSVMHSIDAGSIGHADLAMGMGAFGSNMAQSLTAAALAEAAAGGKMMEGAENNWQASLQGHLPFLEGIHAHNGLDLLTSTNAALPPPIMGTTYDSFMSQPMSSLHHDDNEQVDIEQIATQEYPVYPNGHYHEDASEHHDMSGGHTLAGQHFDSPEAYHGHMPNSDLHSPGHDSYHELPHEHMVNSDHHSAGHDYMAHSTADHHAGYGNGHYSQDDITSHIDDNDVVDPHEVGIEQVGTQPYPVGLEDPPFEHHIPHALPSAAYQSQLLPASDTDTSGLIPLGPLSAFQALTHTNSMSLQHSSPSFLSRTDSGHHDHGFDGVGTNHNHEVAVFPGNYAAMDIGNTNHFAAINMNGMNTNPFLSGSGYADTSNQNALSSMMTKPIYHDTSFTDGASHSSNQYMPSNFYHVTNPYLLLNKQIISKPPPVLSKKVCGFDPVSQKMCRNVETLLKFGSKLVEHGVGPGLSASQVNGTNANNVTSPVIPVNSTNVGWKSKEKATKKKLKAHGVGNGNQSRLRPQVGKGPMIAKQNNTISKQPNNLFMGRLSLGKPKSFVKPALHKKLPFKVKLKPLSTNASSNIKRKGHHHPLYVLVIKSHKGTPSVLKSLKNLKSIYNKRLKMHDISHLRNVMKSLYTNFDEYDHLLSKTTKGGKHTERPARLESFIKKGSPLLRSTANSYQYNQRWPTDKGALHLSGQVRKLKDQMAKLLSMHRRKTLVDKTSQQKLPPFFSAGNALSPDQTQETDKPVAASSIDQNTTLESVVSAPSTRKMISESEKRLSKTAEIHPVTSKIEKAERYSAHNVSTSDEHTNDFRPDMSFHHEHTHEAAPLIGTSSNNPLSSIESKPKLTAQQQKLNPEDTKDDSSMFSLTVE